MKNGLFWSMNLAKLVWMAVCSKDNTAKIRVFLSVRFPEDVCSARQACRHAHSGVRICQKRKIRRKGLKVSVGDLHHTGCLTATNCFSFFSGFKIERLKGVFITQSGIFGYNLTLDALTEMALDECAESQVEIIATDIDAKWENQLIECFTSN